MGPLAGLLTILAITASPAAPRGPVLENDAIRLEWDTRRGPLRSLGDKPSGRQWREPVASAGYRVQLGGQSKPVWTADAVEVRVRNEEGSVLIEARHDEPLPLTVICRFWPERGGRHVLGRIAVRSSAPCRIAEVRFPVLPLRLPFSGTGEEDQVLLPECDGIVIRNPSVNRPDRQPKYPGGASMQMMAALDPAAGLYLAARDTQAHAKMFCSRRAGSKGPLELSIAHLPPQTAVSRWELPYDVALAGLRPSEGFGKITWEAAADLYRPWAVKQPWCRQTMAQRVAAGDVPKWLVEPPLIFTVALRGKMPDGTTGNRGPLVVAQTRQWSSLVGAPVPTLVMSWEKLDSWTTPDYFPPYGGQEAFAAMTRELHAQGHRTMVFLSGLRWTLRKDLVGPDRPPVHIDQQAEFDRRGRASAISDEQGQAEIVGVATKGVGQHATICPTTALAREILLGTSLGCQELGIDCVQVDQIVGGGMRPCFHPKHDHPPGGGNWCAQALYRLFAEIRKQGKARDRAFGFSIEEPGEFYIPLLDTYHSRDLHQGRWPRSGAGVLGVPLFTHVYHDYVAGYGSEGCYLSDRPSKLAMYQLGMNLVCAKIPAVAIWGRWCDPQKLDAAQARLLRAHSALWRGPAREFLSFGQRVASPELDVPAIDMTFVEKDGKTRRPLAVPAVLHGVWRLPDGRSGMVFACIHDKPVRFRFGREELTLEPGEAVFRTSP